MQPSDSPFYECVKAALESIVRVDHIIDENRLLDHMRREDAAQVAALVDAHLVSYSRAAHLADSLGLYLFSVVPKHHWLWHWAARAMWMHPCKSSTMEDEHFVGIIKTVAKNCTHSAPLHKVPLFLMERYRWAMSLAD